MVTIQDVIDKLTEPVDLMNETVDTIEFGHPDTEVKGIATTFMATHHVIQQAEAMDVNLLITHEGTFYSHTDRTNSLVKDPVYQEKRRLIEKSGMVIYRFHDYLHRYNPDGIMTGLVQSLGWESNVNKYNPTAVTLDIPAMTAMEAAEYVKRKLGVSFVRIAGDSTMTCRRVGLLVGYRGGGSTAIPLFENEHPDLIIAGEGPEWETPEYVRDAVYQGRRKALIMLGHAQSEEPGMKYLAEMVKRWFPDMPVHFLSEKPIFQVV